MRFLIQCPHAWRGVWQRPHHLALRFAAAGHDVRWIEPRYLRWLIDDPARFRAARPERPAPRLQTQPVTLLNGERFGPIRRLNLARQAAALRREPRAGKAPTGKGAGGNGAGGNGSAAAATGPVVLWIYNPHEAALARLVPHDLLVYDIMDEYRAFPWAPPSLADEEDRLLRKADWVFAGTGALFDAKRPLAGGRIECVLSGVEPERFAPRAATGAGAPNAPTDMRALRARFRRLVGYAGMVDFRLDQPLLVEAARRRPDWAFVLVGPARVDISALRAEPNIILTGERPYRALPAIYHSWDAAMLPFIEHDVTRHINPTKMLEYAAAGLPIVARALPDVERFYSEGAFLYRDAPGFGRALDAILEGDAAPHSRPEVAARLAVADAWANDRSWDRIAHDMLTKVGSLLRGKTDRAAAAR